MQNLFQSRRWVLSLVAGTLMVLPAVPAGAQADKPLTKLVVQGGSPAPSLAYLPMYVAQAAGFLREGGVDLEVRYSQGAPLAAQLVSSGNADVASMTFEPLLMGHDKGIQGKFFYQYSNEVIYSIAVLKDGAIKSPADLKDKALGVASMTSAAVPIARAILRDAKVDTANVKFIPVGAGAPAVAALKGGTVQAIALWLEAYAAMEGDGLQLQTFHLPAFKGVGNAGYFAGRALQEKPDALKAFVRGIAKANVFMSENPEAAVRILWGVSQSFRGSGPEDAALKTGVASVKAMVTAWRGNDNDRKAYGYINPSAVDAYQKVLLEEGVIKTTLPVNQIVTNEMIDFANKFDVEAVRKFAREWKAK